VKILELPAPRKIASGAVKLNRMRFAVGRGLPQGRAMNSALNSPTCSPRNPLVIALFCAILGIIAFAAFMH